MQLMNKFFLNVEKKLQLQIETLESTIPALPYFKNNLNLYNDILKCLMVYDNCLELQKRSKLKCDINDFQNGNIFSWPKKDVNQNHIVKGSMYELDAISSPLPNVTPLNEVTEPLPETSRPSASLSNHHSGCLFLFPQVCGVAMMCVGAAIQLNLLDIAMVITDATSGAPAVLTIMGVLNFFMSIFGAVSVLKENYTMIKVFAGMMLAIFFMEIMVGMAAYIHRDKVRHSILKGFLKTLSTYKTETKVRSSVDILQIKFKCCGATNYTDWFSNTTGLNHMTVPLSCCKKMEENCRKNINKTSAANIYQQGCVNMVNIWIQQHIGVIGGLGIGFGFVQVVAMTLSYLLLKALQQNYRFV
ncbi:CD63 antigen-like [Protopterus annectens]|uniref:CD63 antigen-like n=1 Tax=Protopterus annectens TaxID=7888 RepID=UPI001CFADFD3|nr:CD63 antigen-like [Protopterus annectens]